MELAGGLLARLKMSAHRGELQLHWESGVCIGWTGYCDGIVIVSMPRLLADDGTDVGSLCCPREEHDELEQSGLSCSAWTAWRERGPSRAPHRLQQASLLPLRNHIAADIRSGGPLAISYVHTGYSDQFIEAHWSIVGGSERRASAGSATPLRR